MIDGIELLYQQIADSMAEAIPEDWSKAKLEAIFFPGSVTYLAEYTCKVDGKERSFASTRSGQRAFRELRKKFKDAGHPLWGQATFELYSNGKFNMKWGYDNCDENGDTRYNEDAEARRIIERHKRLTAD